MRETRTFSVPVEARAVEADGTRVIAGHASVFDAEYELWGFRERVARGAFKKSINEGDVAALWNHDPSVVLGRNKSGTLRLAEDETGLYYEVDLPDTQAARDLYTLIERGDVYQSSFAFEIQREEWTQPAEDSRELPLRTIKQVRLYDVSPVTYPASPATDIDIKRAVRSLADALGLTATDQTTVPELMAQAQRGQDATETQELGQPAPAPEPTSPQATPRTFTDFPTL